MITEILQEGGPVETPVVELCFWYVGHHRNWGFCFPCDADGRVNLAGLNPKALENYEKCRSGKMVPPVEPEEIVRRLSISREPRIGRCECGASVCLDRFTNTCDRCGRDYNSAGTELGPREFWGEETGEHPSECV